MKKEKVEKTTSITYGNRIAKLRTKKKVVRGGGMSSDFALLVGSFKDTAEVPPERALGSLRILGLEDQHPKLQNHEKYQNNEKYHSQTPESTLIITSAAGNSNRFGTSTSKLGYSRRNGVNLSTHIREPAAIGSPGARPL